MASEINIQEVLRSIQDEAQLRSKQKPHPDQLRLSNRKIHLTVPRPPFFTRIYRAVKTHKFRIVYKLPLLGYGIRFASNLIRLPIRIEQLYQGVDVLNGRLLRVESLLGELGKRQDNQKSDLGLVQDHLQLVEANIQLVKNETKATLDAASDVTAQFYLMVERVTNNLELNSTSSIASSVQYEDTHLLDKFYYDFENRFRGTQEDIRRRLSAYIPYLTQSEIDFKVSPLLDVGCGRGEWLKLLKESGINCRGVDLNRIMVDECRKAGIDVQETDVFAYLRELPANSIGCVTGFHIVEHLPFKVLMRMIDEVQRVLVPGGLAIFETPNPENLIVGACNFYTDPTHLNPIPPHTLTFLMENRGFVNNLVVRSSPIKMEFSNQALKEVQHLFYGDQDYAVISYKNNHQNS